ncbi:FAD/FMN-containing dehydrogenase [Bradyrhizobium sp. LM2.7]
MVTPIEHSGRLLGTLRDKLGAAAVLTGSDVPARNCNDWSASQPQMPLAVIRPLDALGVADAILTCREARLPFVPQGGLTGLCRGASPEAGWVAISLERMSGIEEIDRTSATMTVKSGTPLETIQKARPMKPVSSFRSISARAAPARSAATSRPMPAATV